MSENAKNHTKEQDKATARPWIFREDDLSIRTEDFNLPQCGQGDYRGQIIASVDPSEWARSCRADVIPRMKANAAFIVKAVNSHDTLVELVEDLREYFADCADASAEGDPLEFKPNQEMTILEKIESALKLAKGEEKS